jgi:tetratricopeptide (TPR) repeat protein
MARVSIEQALELAVEHHRAGRLSAAEKIYRRILSTDPGNGNALYLLGSIAGQDGRLDLAIELFSRAVTIKPDYAEAFNNLGNVWRGKGEKDRAVACYQRAIALRPEYAEAHNNLAIVWREMGNLEGAVAQSLAAIQFRNDFFEAYDNLGNCLKAQNQFEEAAAAFEKAALAKPGSVETFGNWADALCEVIPFDGLRAGSSDSKFARLEEAVEVCRRAIAVNPRSGTAYSNLGLALTKVGKLSEAIAAYEKAIALEPEDAGVHWNLALSLLQNGDFARGWAEYEWRWKKPGFTSRVEVFPQPIWRGEDLAGKTILLTDEQGIGDTIQFARYAPLVARRGGKVVLRCQAELVRLMKSLTGVERVVSHSDELPAFDYYLPLLSLPGIFGTSVGTIPAEIPYLRADDSVSARWAEKIRAGEKSGDGLEKRIAAAEKIAPAKRIGLVWAGGASHRADRHRSIALSRFLPLLENAGLRFYSLQKGPAVEQISSLREEIRPLDLGGELSDFTETAAVIANLDLVISVDTAVLHLAGALRKPVWVLLPMCADWRWLVDRGDSPWYPTMRLFRQEEFGDWAGVIGRVAAALGSF